MPTLRRAFLLGVAVQTPLAQAFSVGDAELRSSLLEPLAVRVPVSAAHPSEIGSATQIQARLAGLDDYARYGLPPPPLPLDAMYLHVSGSDLDFNVHVSSTQMVREPAATLLLEIQVGGTRVIKEVPLIFEPGSFEAPVRPAPKAAPRTQTVASLAPAVLEGAPRLERPPTETAPALPQVATAPAAKAPNAAPRSPAPNRRRQGLSRFRLDTQFSSYAQLARQGLAPAPVGATAAPTAEAPMETPAVASVPQQSVLATGPTLSPQAPHPEPLPEPASRAAAAPALAPEMTRTDRGLGALPWWLWPLAALALLALARPRARQRVARAELDREATRTAAVPEVAAAPVTPVPTPLPFPVPAPNVAPVMEAAGTISSGIELRRRFQALSGGSVNANHLRQRQIFEAYLDMGKTDSALRLLEELEEQVRPKRQSLPPMRLVKSA